MKRTVLAGALALTCWSAQAADDVAGWRIGAAASFSDFEWSDGSTDLISDTSVGAKLTLQYQFGDLLGIEGAYHNTGDFSDDLVTSNDPNTPTGAYDLNFSGFSVAAIGYLPFGTEGLKFYGKVGYFDFDDELSFNGFVSSNGSESGFMAGGGATIEVTERFGLRIDGDWFDAEVGDLWSVNLGLEYSFGGSGGSSAAMSAPPPPPPPPPDVPADPEPATE